MRHPPKRPLVGVIVNCSDTYGRAILRGVARYANLQRQWLLLKDLERVWDAVQPWPHFDAAIVAGVSAAVLRRVIDHCRHVVQCSGSGDPRVAPVVALDDVAAGAQAAECLANCQLRHFAFYGFKADYKVSLNRLAGFRDALAGRGHTCGLCPLATPSSAQRSSHSHWPALIAWLGNLPKPAGIFCIDDTQAHDLAAACLEARIAVPDDVAIVGVNNDDLLCESAWPPLSSVDADYSRVGYMAARTLHRMLDDHERLPAAERMIRLPPLGVVQRQSTSTLAIDDPDVVDAVRYIREHACEPCSVPDVLRHVPVNRRWLERKFVAKLGRTPHEEIARVRIEVAQRLLLRLEVPLDEIAARCGFQEIKTFYSAFRRSTGTTPAAYRRRSLVGRS